MRIMEDAFPSEIGEADFPCRTLMRLPIAVLAQGLETLPMIAGLVDPDRNLLVANRAYHDYFGPDDAISYEDRRRFVYAEDVPESEAVWSRAERLGRMCETELRLLRHATEPRRHQLRVTPLLATRDRLVGMFFIAIDIHEEIRRRPRRRT